MKTKTPRRQSHIRKFFNFVFDTALKKGEATHTQHPSAPMPDFMRAFFYPGK
jgi:hypothetical protein